MEVDANYQTKLRHRQRLELAVSHVLGSLDAPISLRETAELSYYSPVHFQSIFSECLGETFFEYVLRNRLFLAAKRLTETYEKLNDLALLAGFSSQANFTRAFKQWFNTSPAMFRKEYYGHQVSPVIKSKRKRKRRAQAVPQIELMPEAILLSSSAKGYMSSRFDHTLWSAVTRLCDMIQGLDGAVPLSAHPIYLAPDVMDMTRLDQGTKMATVKVDRDKVTSDLQSNIFEVRGGAYATFSHQGILPEQTLNIGMFDWLPASDYTLDSNRPVFMKSNQLSMGEFAQVVRKRNISKDQCMFCDGLKMDVSQLEKLKVMISIPVIAKRDSL